MNRSSSRRMIGTSGHYNSILSCNIPFIQHLAGCNKSWFYLVISLDHNVQMELTTETFVWLCHDRMPYASDMSIAYYFERIDFSYPVSECLDITSNALQIQNKLNLALYADVLPACYISQYRFQSSDWSRRHRVTGASEN